MKRLLLLVAVLLALPTAALAHGDTGTIELVSAEPSGPTSVDYVVRLTYVSDGDAVADTEVTVSVDGAAPLAMDAQGDGRYAATADFPDAGEHAVRFTAVEPAAELEHVQAVAAATTTTSTTDAPNVAEEPLPDPDTTDGSSTWLLVLMAIIVVAMVVLAVAFVRGRRPPT